MTFSTASKIVAAVLCTGFSFGFEIGFCLDVLGIKEATSLHSFFQDGGWYVVGDWREEETEDFLLTEKETEEEFSLFLLPSVEEEENDRD